MPPQIIKETKDYLVINKPSGLIVHADGKTVEPTLTDWILEHYPEIRDVGEPWVNGEGETIYRPGIVHRLDRETSGVMVVARNQEMFELLKSEFKNREVRKVYHAFVYGKVKDDRGKIERPIGRSASDFRKYSAQRGARGELREAVTLYRVLWRGEGVTMIEAMPQTGRTHQIRVHMKAINHPVVGDSLYAPNHESLLGFKRTALHARSLEFTDLKGKRVTFEAPYPEDFMKAVEEVGGEVASS